MKRTVLLLTICLFAACNSNNNDQLLEITLEPGEQDLNSTPVYADVSDGTLNENSTLCAYSGDNAVPAQVVQISESEQRIWWKADKSAAESVTYSFREGGDCSAQTYTWETVADQSRLLQRGNQPVLQYEHPVFDYDDIENTKKPFHHLYDPAGDQLITKGTGGLYPHHRGIFLGYNHVYINGERIDIWHARDGERSEHTEFVKEYAGPVTGGHIVEIHWKDHDGETFLTENRELRAFSPAEDVTIIDFQSNLTAVDGPVRLEGDRQHAGVQFRAAQYVADNSEQSQYIRPDYLSHLEPDDEIEGPDMLDLPWNAFQFVVEGRPYVVSYLSHPSNPEGAEMSERLYGRFGEFFPYELTADNPLQVQYRFVVKSGNLTADEIEAYYQQYINHPVAELN